MCPSHLSQRVFMASTAGLAGLAVESLLRSPRGGLGLIGFLRFRAAPCRIWVSTPGHLVHQVQHRPGYLSGLSFMVYCLGLTVRACCLSAAMFFSRRHCPMPPPLQNIPVPNTCIGGSGTRTAVSASGGRLGLSSFFRFMVIVGLSLLVSLSLQEHCIASFPACCLF